MDSVSLVIGLCNIGTAILLMAVLVPLWLQRIPRNRWYGFRFHTTLHNDEAWYAVNKYGAEQMLIWAVALLVFGLICLFIPMEQTPVAAFIAGSASLVLLIPAAQSWWFARRYRE